MDTILSKRIGLIAGDGELPVKLAQSAKNSGFEITAISLCPDNKRQLSDCCHKVYAYGPGQVQKILDTLKSENISQISFIGKVNKGMLLRNLRLDSRAIKILKSRKKLNDDSLMLGVIEELEQENISVLDQTIFLREMMASKGPIGKYVPDEAQMLDIEYGFNIAKEIGKLDLGQSVVAQNKMILAVEAIEGTDRVIERGCKLGNGSAVVVKVSKPNQDNRFDVPAIGLNTLKTMKKHGGKVLAVEAGETFVVEKEKMVEFADRNKMVLIGI